MNFQDAYKLLSHEDVLCPYKTNQRKRGYDFVNTWENISTGQQILYYVSNIKGTIICCRMEALRESATTYYNTILEFQRECPRAFQSHRDTLGMLGKWHAGCWSDCIFVPHRILSLL